MVQPHIRKVARFIQLEDFNVPNMKSYLVEWFLVKSCKVECKSKCLAVKLHTVGSGDHGCLFFAKIQTSGDNSKIQIFGESLKHLKFFRDIWSTK